MTPIIRGTRPRPRVGLIGDYPREEIVQFEHLFPTLRKFPTLIDIEMEVEVKELDLIVIGQNTSQSGNPMSNYFLHVPVISFSPYFTLPGPTENTILSSFNKAKHEEFVLPTLKLPFHKRREADLIEVENIKGWSLPIISVPSGPPSAFSDEINKANKIFKDGAIIIDRNKDIPLASIYKRYENNLGIAWLPNAVFDQVLWVELIAMEWAQDDKERFPEFGDWRKLPEWMTTEEEALLYRIDQLEANKQEAIIEFDQKIASLHSNLASATLAANKGLRRLITSQGDILVDEVTKVFQEFGFEVDNIDEIIDPKLPKREDLRLRDPSDNSDWEAIVEVRGYAKRTGNTADFQRISKFTTQYQKEKGHLPDKKIYVVNGQIEIDDPDQRQNVLASAEENIRVFGEDDGIVISTIDLFRAMKVLDQLGRERIKESIKNTVGRWSLESIED